MYIRDIKISLTNFECFFINYLIENNGYCNICSFSSDIRVINRKCVCHKSLVVYVNRLRKKIYYQTGDKPIKSKYGFGYYLNN